MVLQLRSLVCCAVKIISRCTEGGGPRGLLHRRVAKIILLALLPVHQTVVCSKNSHEKVIFGNKWAFCNELNM